MKCAIFEEHSSSCVVYSRFSGTLFPVSMIDGDIDDTDDEQTHNKSPRVPIWMIGTRVYS